MAGRVALGQMNVSVEVVRRQLLPPLPGSAEPRHSYERVFGTRAKVRTRGGDSEIARVDINGKKATHTFTILYTKLAFDVRDRLRDATGQLYQILSIETVDLQGEVMNLHCSNQGVEDVVAAR